MLDILRELGALSAGLLLQGVEGVPHCLQTLDELLGVGGNLLTGFGENVLFLLLELLGELGSIDQ